MEMLLAPIPGVPSRNHRLSKLSINASDRWHHNSTKEQGIIRTEEFEQFPHRGLHRPNRREESKAVRSRARWRKGRVPIVLIIWRAIGSLLVWSLDPRLAEGGWWSCEIPCGFLPWCNVGSDHATAMVSHDTSWRVVLGSVACDSSISRRSGNAEWFAFPCFHAWFAWNGTDNPANRNNLIQCPRERVE